MLVGGTGEPVMLLHGGGADSALVSWGATAEALAADFRVYLPDWPGYGQSEPWDRTLRSEDLPAIVEQIRQTLEIDRLTLVGISMGGLASIAYALGYPDNVDRIVVFGSGGVQDWAPYHFIAWPLLHLPWLGRWMAQWQWKCLARYPALLRRSLRSLLPTHETVPEALVDLIAAELRNREDHTVFFRWQRDEVRLRGLRANFTSRLAELRAPTLVVHGTRDIAAPVRYARRAARLIPNARYEEIEGGGHWLPREFPERSGQLVREFLRQQP
ncbi:MAG: alpha/beta hydrolase [Myxococcota bacterium]